MCSIASTLLHSTSLWESKDILNLLFLSCKCGEKISNCHFWTLFASRRDPPNKGKSYTFKTLRQANLQPGMEWERWARAQLSADWQRRISITLQRGNARVLRSGVLRARSGVGASESACTHGRWFFHENQNNTTVLLLTVPSHPYPKA